MSGQCRARREEERGRECAAMHHTQATNATFLLLQGHANACAGVQRAVTEAADAEAEHHAAGHGLTGTVYVCTQPLRISRQATARMIQ